MDKIFIKNLEVFARHGVLSEENALGQKFIVSVELGCSARAAGRSDDLEKSVNYADVCALIQKVMTENTFKLIEAAAEKIAESILLAYKNVQSVTVNLKKPWAPIMLNVKTVGVEIKRSRHTVYIALGSNMGDKQAHLSDAVKEIDANPLCSVTKVSDFIITEPVGDIEQDDFLNGCIEVVTLLTPHELLDFIHEIEQRHHRERSLHWGPRTLDLDIIIYDDLIMADDTLIIPHPEAHKRQFVLEPLAQIAPFAFFPLQNMRINEVFEKQKQLFGD